MNTLEAILVCRGELAWRQCLACDAWHTTIPDDPWPLCDACEARAVAKLAGMTAEDLAEMRERVRFACFLGDAPTRARGGG